MKNNEMLLATMFLIMALLAGGFMYAMFRGKPFDRFEMSRLYFAAGTMAVLGYIFILSMIFYALGSTDSNGEGAGKAIFDACVKVIPPIITLIIGFYFGAHSKASELPADRLGSAGLGGTASSSTPTEAEGGQRSDA